jgi:hypothetical protein
MDAKHRLTARVGGAEHETSRLPITSRVPIFQYARARGPKMFGTNKQKNRYRLA